MTDPIASGGSEFATRTHWKAPPSTAHPHSGLWLDLEVGTGWNQVICPRGKELVPDLGVA